MKYDQVPCLINKNLDIMRNGVLFTSRSRVGNALQVNSMAT